jgi:hypothetical protein
MVENINMMKVYIERDGILSYIIIQRILLKNKKYRCIRCNSLNVTVHLLTDNLGCERLKIKCKNCNNHVLEYSDIDNSAYPNSIIDSFEEIVYK